MSSFVDASPTKSDGLWNFPQPLPVGFAESGHSVSVPSARSHDDGSLILSILTTSLCVHLLIIGLIGARLPEDPAQPQTPPSSPPTRFIEDVRLESQKIPAPPPSVKLDKVLPPPLPASAPRIDLPPLPQIAPVAAVPASVPVAFALHVAGPVHLVGDFSQASGTATAASGPQDINDDHLGRNLLIPPITYPPGALLHRVSGEVQVEFRTSATGDIYDAKIRRSSGFETLDWAALENIRHGRWTGEAGYFTKTYDFILN